VQSQLEIDYHDLIPDLAVYACKVCQGIICYHL
jgi:hypothetical protein